MNIEPGEYTVKARLVSDTNNTFEKTYQVAVGGSLVVDLPMLSLSPGYLRNQEITKLNYDEKALQADWQKAQKQQKGWHTGGWVTLGIGTAALGAGAYYLMGMMSSMAAYKSAATSSAAQSASSNATGESVIGTILAGAGGATVCISLPMLFANFGLEKKAKAIQADDAKIKELGVQE